MVDFDKGYLPFFFNWVDNTATLTDKDFGRVVRALVEHFRDGRDPENLPKHLQMAYFFMLDGAKRAVEYQKNASAKARELAGNRWKKSEKKPEKKPEFIDFDVEDQFKRSLERTYGNPEQEGDQ